MSLEERDSYLETFVGRKAFEIFEKEARDSRSKIVERVKELTLEAEFKEMKKKEAEDLKKKEAELQNLKKRKKKK